MKVFKKQNFIFSKDNIPEGRALPGEVLKFCTLDCFSGQFTSEEQLVMELDLSTANPAAGPVYIEGAEPGDVLAVDILDIKVNDVGFVCTIPELGPLSHKAVPRTRMFKVKDGYTEFNGVTWPIDPMIGVIGTAPDDKEIVCGFADDHGGNMDSRIIKKGATVYFPVRVEGALLQMGDLHATMGDGELCGTGIEIGGEVIVKTRLIKNFKLNWPVTETKERWYVNSRGDNYDDSLVKGCEELARLMENTYKWDVSDIFIYLSVQGCVEVNQGARPVHDDMVNLRVGIPKLPHKRLIP